MIVCALNRLLSEFLAIGSHFRFSIIFFSQSIDRSIDGRIEMVHQFNVKSPSCGTTQFDDYHINLCLVTRIFLYTDFLLLIFFFIYRHFFKTSFHFTRTSIDFKFRKYRRIVAQAGISLRIECTRLTETDKILYRPIQQNRHVKRSTLCARGRSCL